LIILFFPSVIFAQSGGVNSFQFFDIQVSPKVESLGGSGISLPNNNDVSLTRLAPSLLNEEMNNNFVFAFSDYFSDVNILSFSFARKIDNLGLTSANIQTINYGLFDYTDDFGNVLGEFSASDQIFSFSLAKKISSFFTLGMSLNLLNSKYSNYSSIALSSNISSTYFNNNDLCITLLIKNIGKQLKKYNVAENLPTQLELALSKKLKYLPFTYHISYKNLQNFDISSPYKINNSFNYNSVNLNTQKESFAKTFLRHLIIGGELRPFNKSLFLRGGFNFQRRFDMSLSSYPSFVGFSFGVGFEVVGFVLDYSRSSYHISGTTNNFSITTNINNFAL